ncbi:hypothetical protein K3495_g12181, partial [Podosphaera aphanis]
MEHGYNVEPIQQVEPLVQPIEPAKRATRFVKRLREAEELAQAAMSSSQHRMEEYANQKKKESEIFKVGDQVWLNLRNIQTPQLSKKLSWITAKYKVTKVIDSHCVELNSPSGIWPRFHVDLLKRAAADPLLLVARINVVLLEDMQVHMQVKILLPWSKHRERGRRE